MTALCPTCETTAHCAKHGCIPVSGDAPVPAAHRVVCDGQEADPRYAAADALLQCAHAFWKSERDAGQPGAVKWLTGDDGSLVIFTRGEYRADLLRAVDDVGCKVHDFTEATTAAAPSPIPVVEAGGWMPIETAPEGEQVLVYMAAIQAVDIAHRREDNGRWVSGGGTTWPLGVCTHWMALPEAPK